MSPHSSVCNIMVLDVPSGLTVNISFHHGYHSILVASQWTLKKYWFLVYFWQDMNTKRYSFSTSAGRTGLMILCDMKSRFKIRVLEYRAV